MREGCLSRRLLPKGHRRRTIVVRIFHKSRKYPIITDESGRSARRQAFDLFREGYRPSRILKEDLVPISMKTLLRYFED